MTNTREYIAMSEQIRHARKARELHGLTLKIENSNFAPAEKESLLGKVRASFSALNAMAVAADPANRPQGRFTLLPRAVHALILALCLCAFVVQSAPIPESLAVNAIIGEAGNQPFATQVRVACAIRNRGSLTGVYGVNNPVVKQASAKVRARAYRAWKVSALSDLTHGLRYFGCATDAPYMLACGLRPAMKSGAITFWQ